MSFPAYVNALSSRGAQVETRTIDETFNVKELLADARNFDRVVIAGGDDTISICAGISG